MPLRCSSARLASSLTGGSPPAPSCPLADGGVELAGHQPGEVVVEAPVLGDGHLVVVENHQHVLVDVAGVIEGLEGHAGGDGAITDDRDHLAAKPLALGRHRHAERRPDGGAGWPTPSTSYSLSSRQGKGAGHLSGEWCECVPVVRSGSCGIGLVAYVPHQPIEGVL